MTAKIKLNAASGGGSFSLQAPSSSSNNRVFTIPDSADGTVLTTTNPKVGNIIQIVQAVKTDTFTHSTETFTDVTGLSVAITPSTTSNKILIQYSGCMGGEQNRSGHIRLVRVIGGTTTTNLFVGDQGATTAQARASSTCTHANTYYISAFSGEFLDSPSTTSSITYKLQLASGDEGTNQRIGRTHDNSNEFSRSKTPSSITVFEVAA